MKLKLLGLAAITLAASIGTVSTLSAKETKDESKYAHNPNMMSAMKWRNVGPYRGGRSTTVSGVADQPHVYYMGTVGGGVWRTTNAGASWKNITDGQLGTSSVGAVEVAPSDPNVIYVGMGESPVRNVATSHGDGIYKSTDAGKTWKHIGLPESQHISRIQIHPENPDIVYVAVQGHLYAPNEERGVYKSTDGGQTWTKSLYVSDRSGAVDLSMDTTNPRILYAAMWDHMRTPWLLESGPNSSLHKSTDGGETWTKLEGGLPKKMGKLGVTVSPANPNRVWAVIEAEKSGVYRSNDAGKTWRQTNSDRALIARSWYYMHIFADPQDENTVFVLNAPMMKSVDGGKTFSRIPTPHGDNHGLWMNPNNSDYMVQANDGGANVSWDGGKSWSRQDNQPTAQFYRLALDRKFPYTLYGAQQDNSTVAIASRSMSGKIGRDDWTIVGGGESSYLAFDPDNPELIYASNIIGLLTEYDASTGLSRNIMPYADFHLAQTGAELKYRANWNPPLITSPHDPSVIYYGAQKVLKTSNRGNSWEEISPDLTKNEADKLGRRGVPFTDEGAGAETYNTIMYLMESTHEQGTLWAGTDDGLVQLTRDGGATWQDVTPRGLKDGIVNSIELSPHDPATAYIAVMRYKFDDYEPYLYKTENYGRSWKRIDKGLPKASFVRAIREDRGQKGLLYAGTETGMHVSFNNGKDWQPLQLNLPNVPITDIQISHTDDLVVSTQGRGFWILDGLAPLRVVSSEEADSFLYPLPKTYRLGASGYTAGKQGASAPRGQVIYTYFKSKPDPKETKVSLDILASDGTVIRSYSNQKSDGAMCYSENQNSPRPKPYGMLKLKEGMNRLEWNLRRENYDCVPGMYIAGSWAGYRVVPGTYTARLTVNDDVSTQTFELLDDPRLERAEGAIQSQQAMLTEVYDMINANHAAITKARSIKKQIADIVKLTKAHANAETLHSSAKDLKKALDEWEHSIAQPKNETSQDIVNFRPNNNEQLMFLIGAVDGADQAPTQGMIDHFNDLKTEWTERHAAFKALIETDLVAVNSALQNNGAPIVYAP